jgi:hypothetical protein
MQKESKTTIISSDFWRWILFFEFILYAGVTKKNKIFFFMQNVKKNKSFRAEIKKSSCLLFFF